ncbi:hypothetical protein D1614_09875 [Maribellus luteus]|uniref:Uncharacterized protein n=1 Tax=Maribellus luteus TaxID=2305463 RepID=A0A399T1D1_9BACT|nr:hypothetical protein [Maribellus luteus]RIJ48824.1 hypothetical protein D1614_09875 [Maribellus luteus]
MEVQALRLHFSQLIKAWEKSKHNTYFDKGKDHYQETLKYLIKAISDENFTLFNSAQIEERRRIINFIFKSLGILDSSTTNQFPFEIIHCLQHALDEWVDPSNEKFVIVTSLINSYDDFYSFDGNLALDDVAYNIIQKVYNLTFEYRLIQINLPKFLARDYFSNIVLYHELGHFIDFKYQITAPFAIEIQDKYNNKKYNASDLVEFQKFFPYEFWKREYLDVLTSHLREYFSDLFAAQYIGKYSENLLNYVSGGPLAAHAISGTHPSTKNRGDLVKDFLKNNSSTFINDLKVAINLTSGKELKVRYSSEIKNSNLIKLLPIEIKTGDELSSVFVAAWELYDTYTNQIEKQNNFKYPLISSKVYEIINNLVEKSIGNYIVTSNWEKSKNVLS